MMWIQTISSFGVHLGIDDVAALDASSAHLSAGNDVGVSPSGSNIPSCEDLRPFTSWCGNLAAADVGRWNLSVPVVVSDTCRASADVLARQQRQFHKSYLCVLEGKTLCAYDSSSLTDVNDIQEEVTVRFPIAALSAINEEAQIFQHSENLAVKQIL